MVCCTCIFDSLYFSSLDVFQRGTSTSSKFLKFSKHMKPENYDMFIPILLVMQLLLILSNKMNWPFCAVNLNYTVLYLIWWWTCCLCRWKEKYTLTPIWPLSTVHLLSMSKNNDFKICTFWLQICRRFHSSITPNQKWLRERSHESYAKNYSMVFPHDEPLAGRNMRRDPFHKVRPAVP